MRISVLQENLLSSLQDVRKAVTSKPQLPILSCILLKADETGLSLAATDLYLGVQSHVRAVVEEPGTFAVPAKTFADLVQSLEAGQLTLLVDGSKLQIKSKKSSTSLQGFPGEDFPPFPEKTGQTVSLAQKDLDQIVSLVLPAAAKDDSRPVLTSILFAAGPDGATDVVATDGFRLAKLSITQTFGEQSILLPVSAVQEVARLGQKQSQAEINLTISDELKQVFCQVGEVEITIRLMEGAFPPYQKVIPAQTEQTMVVDAGELESQLKTSLVLARDAGNIMTFAFGEAELTLKTVSPTAGEHQSSIPLLQAATTPIEIAFNGHYVLDFLKAVKADRVTVGANQPLQPVIFMVDGKPEYQHVIMPFRINQ